MTTLPFPTYEEALLEATRAIPLDWGICSGITNAGGNTVVDESKRWATDIFRDKLVKIIRGFGAGQVAQIDRNNGQGLITKDPLPLGLNTTSVYVILDAYDPKVSGLISYRGETTANGAADGSTLIDTNLTTKPDYDGNQVIITSGPYIGQARDIVGATNGGTVNPHQNFGGQITQGTKFVIAALRTVPAEVAALAADVGNASASALGSLYAILGNPAQDFLTMIGYEGATSLADKLTAARAALIDYIGDPSGHTLTTLAAKWGDIARSLDLILGPRWDVAGDLGTDIASILTDIAALETKLDALGGAAGIFYEQADAAVNINAVNTGETDVFHLSAASTRYIVRSLRLKCADPGANTVTVRLYEVVNDVLTEVDSFAITNANFGTYHSLMDMFGLPHLAGDELQVTVRASAGGPYQVLGQYSFGKTNV